MSSIYAPAPYAPDGGPTTTAPVGGGAQVVPLQDVLRVLRATFTDPRAGSPAPLPAHRWDLQRVDDPSTVVRSTRSNADGETYLVKDPKIVVASPTDTWFLTLRPELSEADLLIARSAGEAWIDLEANRWVSMWPRPTLEKRKLVRVPLWTSRWKAGCGGFSSAFGARFADEGLLETSDLRAPAGVPPTWEIRIDYGWHVTWVRFQHYDTAQKKTVSLPPGLCLEAIGRKRRIDGTEDDGLRVGAGTCLDEQGTIYVLHERTREHSEDVELSWSGLGDAYVALDDDSPPAERIRTGKPPEDPRTRYVLPDAFCSRGWEARLGTGPRRKWSTLRTSATTSRATPLVFHLDDTILVDFDTGPVAVEPDTRLVLFDHRLAFRKPVDGVLPPFWTGRLAENYLRAEDSISTDGDAFEQTAFVIHREGDFFVLRDDRVRGRDDATPCVGARAALARSPQNPSHRYEKGTAPPGYGIGTAELHLFPDAYPGPYDPDREGKFLAENAGTMLCHLLVHVSFSIQPDPEGPADVAATYGLLMDAAERWDQAHPCWGAKGRKDYVLVPDGEVRDGTRVVKLRHFFAPRMKGEPMARILCANHTNQQNRSYVDAETLTLHLNMNDAGQTMSVFGLDAGDAIPFSHFVIAHELGHVLGIPDEYAANLYFEPHLGLDYKTEPRPLRFPQREPGYPFHTDVHAMMMNACCPRVRYVQCYASFLDAHRELLERSQPSAQGASADYVARYAEYGVGLTYRRKRGATPWAAIGQGTLANNRAQLALFGCGEDEGLVDKMFPRQPGVASGDWLDGILVVRTRVWFDFVESSAGRFHGHLEPWHVIQGFYRELVDRQWTPRVCFFLEAPSADDLRRVGVIFEVLSEYGALPSPNATIGEANVVAHVPFAGGSPKLGAPMQSGPMHVVAGPTSFAWSVLRKVLEPPAATGGAGLVPLPSNSPLQASDVGEVARALETMLGRARGTYSVRTISIPWKP